MSNLLKQRRTLEERLWRRVERRPDGCWVFTGSRNNKNYGQIHRGPGSRELVLVHRAAWEVTYGPVPEGLFVLHRCDNPPCCNPEHLFLGTNADNMRDMVAKGRGNYCYGENHQNATLTFKQVVEIREARARGERRVDIARRYGIVPEYVYQLVAGQYRKNS